MDYDAWLDELSKRTGAPVEDSDRERLKNTNPDDPNNPENNDTTRLMQAYEAQYARRGARPDGRDSSELTKAGYGSGRNETADDRRTGGSNVAQAWNSGGGIGGLTGGNTGIAGGLFPDWYRELLTRQQQQQEAAQAENKARGDALYGQLNDRATQGLAIDRNTPVIRQQADAYAANTDRARRNYLSDTAERSGPLANLQGESRMAAERYGQMTGDFEAQLLGRELSARREEISDALHMQGAMLSGDQQRTLQQQLAMMDAAIAEAGIGLGARGQDLNFQLGTRGQDMGMDQFLRDLALREWDTTNRWNYNWQTL